MMKPWLFLILWGLTVICPAGARAVEPNETFATATLLAPSVRTVSDVLTPGLPPDTVLGIRNQLGAIVAVDDDSSPLGSGTASGAFGVPTNNGAINFAVTGCCNYDFLGGHGFFGEYEVFVDVYDDPSQAPIASFSEIRTLEPDAVDEFSFFDAEWIFGAYDVYIDNTIGPGAIGDVDFFTFTGLTPGQTFAAETFAPLAPTADTLLGWFDAAGALIGFNDDVNAQNLLSRIAGTVPANGRLSFAVTGVGDNFFQGDHFQDFPYQLSVTTGGGLLGDFNNDQVVNGADLVAWRAAFGLSAAANADGDGDSDGNDFLIWQRQLGGGAAVPFAAPAPEPGGLMLAGAAAVGIAALRRRRESLDWIHRRRSA